MERKNKYIYAGIRTILAVFLLCTASCTERSLEMRPEPVPIHLYTGIRTRAAMDAFDATSVCIACGTATGSYTECWEGIATDDEIVLTPVRYYPQDGGKLYLRSFYPPAPLNEDGTLTYTLTGEEDLMIASEQRGSLDDPFTADESKTLMHRHLLSKLSFRLQLYATGSGQYKVHTLHLNGLAQQATLSLLTEELRCGGATSSVTVYDAATDAGGGISFEGGVAELPGYVLVQPGAGFTIDMRLVVDDKPENDLIYTDLPIHFESGTGEEGVAYTVSVDIPDPSTSEPEEIKATATVTIWENGSSGSGELVPDGNKNPE